MDKLLVSVVIPAKNEQKYIINVFNGLKKQTYKNFEIIVVDGGSSDDTVKIAQRYSKVIIDRRKGIGTARNTGSKIAKGKIIVFIDADTKPSTKLIESYVKMLKNNVIAATGPILPLEKTNLRTKIGFKFVSIVFVKFAMKLNRPSIIGSNFAVRKDVFEKINGFNEQLMTYEDWDLSKRLKHFGKIIFVDDAIVYTSIRRVRKWGMYGFFVFHVGNMIRYNIFKKPKEYYEEIR